MGKDDEAKSLGSMDVGIEVPGVGGAHVKIGANEGLVKYVAPELYRAQRAFDTLIRGIELKQDRGEELSPQDNQLLAVSAMPILSGKLENVAAVIAEAQAIDPTFGKYVNGKVPMSEPPKMLPSPGVTEGELDIPIVVVQEQQYWWDRFWADAEVVTADYIRRLLGQIAVRGSKDPKAISLRTLDVIRCLEAEVVQYFRSSSEAGAGDFAGIAA